MSSKSVAVNFYRKSSLWFSFIPLLISSLIKVGIYKQIGEKSVANCKKVISLNHFLLNALWFWPFAISSLDLLKKKSGPQNDIDSNRATANLRKSYRQNRRFCGASAIQKRAREKRERARSAWQEISACKHTIVYALPTVRPANGFCWLVNLHHVILECVSKK